MAFSTRLRLKVEQIARMRIAGVKDIIIAQHLNISNATLQRIIRLPDYQDHEEALLMGHVSKMDEALAGNVQVMRQNFKHMVPVACQALLDAVMQKRDLRTALAAAKEILDRDPDGTFSTVGSNAGRVSGLREIPGTTLPAQVLDSAISAGNEIAGAPPKKETVN